MSWSFNPFTGNLDNVGSGGASSGVTLTPPTSDLSYSGEIVTLTAGATLAQGTVCYVGTGNTMLLADNTAAATCPNGVQYYICLTSLTNTQTGLFLRNGFWRDDSLQWSSGQAIYVGVAGAMTTNSPTTEDYVIQTLGNAFGPIGGNGQSHILDFRPPAINVVYKA